MHANPLVMGTTATFGRLLLIITLYLVFVVGLSNQSTNLGLNLQKFSRSHFAFSLDLYSALQKQSHLQENSYSKNYTNLIFSPFSISVALATIFLGAAPGSNTANQLRNSLHMNNLSFHEVHDTFRTILSKFADSYYADLMSMSNSILKHDGLSIHENYREVLRDFYKIRIEEVDDSIVLLPSGTRTLAPETQNTIVKPYRPSGGNCLAIVSEFAFRSDWLFQFNASMTFEKGLFYSSLQKRFEIPMMIGRFKIPTGYSSDLECRVAELPLASKRMSLFIILPDDVEEGVDKLEANLTADIVKTLFSTLKEGYVNFRFPRFRIRPQTADLTNYLRLLGIDDAFDPSSADLSGIAVDKPYVCRIHHKAQLEVDEKGVVNSTHSERLSTFGEKYFEVDHPFLFFLWDYYNGVLLFVGRVTEPEPFV